MGDGGTWITEFPAGVAVRCGALVRDTIMGKKFAFSQ